MASNVIVGPWGGEGGSEWGYSPKGVISRISITYDDYVIYSIKFRSEEENGSLDDSSKYGMNTGSKEVEIDIDIKDEKLISMSGKFGDYNSNGVVITSLSFSTNKNEYGPFGAANGTHFSLEVKEDTFSGFHGRCGWFIDSIGVKLRGEASDEVVGPWGEEGGVPWTYIPNAVISHIRINYDDAIHNINFATKDEGGSIYNSKVFGITEGTKDVEIEIDTAVEKFNSISGTYAPYKNVVTVTSLSFSTNKGRSFGPYGTSTGTYFSYSSEENNLIGFFGKAGPHVGAIGLYIHPRKNILVSPWGGRGGDRSWSYQPKGYISRISITHDDGIHSISFESIDENGDTDVSEKFGDEDSSKNDVIILNLKGEKLNNIMGTVGMYKSLTIVTSLTFSTNKKVYGPFGKVNGIAFSLPVKDGVISGFHGRSGSFIDSIGPYLKPT